MEIQAHVLSLSLGFPNLKPSVVCLIFPFYGLIKCNQREQEYVLHYLVVAYVDNIKTENILNSTHSDNRVGRMAKHCCVYWW